MIWRQDGILDGYSEAQTFCRLLTQAGFPTMMAGGCVRDHLLGLKPNDFDLASAAKPEQVRDFFRERGYKVIPVGLEHGTVSVVTPIQQIQITTLREDIACDGRHAEVNFSRDFRQDALRRDFTINALFMDMHGEIHDHVGGVADLNNQILRFVGDPNARLREDYLRALRYFRFIARLGWEPGTAQLQAIKANLGGLGKLSAERVHNELIQILMARHGGQTIRLMSEHQVLQALFPRFGAEHAPVLAVFLDRLESCNPFLYWFGFYHLGSGGRLGGKALESELQRLRFSRKGRKTVSVLDRIFRNRTEVAVCLGRALELVAKQLLAPMEFKTLVTCYPWEKEDASRAALNRLIHGLATLPAPAIPREALMNIAPGDRGKAIEIAKIYWYCGLIDSREDLARIMKEGTSSEQELCSRDLFA